jgi:hypothetical protein
MVFSPLTKLTDYVTQLNCFKITSVETRVFGARTLVIITYGDNDEGIATVDVTGIDEKEVDTRVIALLNV